MENNFKIDPSLLLDGTEKVGDTIWTINGGDEKIIDIEKSDTYCIKTEDTDYTNKGFRLDEDKYPSAFKRNPFVSQYPKLMEVSDNGEVWEQDEVLCHAHGKYCIYFEGRFYDYKYAREIQPKAVEFSEEQIKYLKEKFNISLTN